PVTDLARRQRPAGWPTGVPAASFSSRAAIHPLSFHTRRYPAMSRRTWIQWFSARARRRSKPRQQFRPRTSQLETLGERITPAVTATFGLNGLTIFGDGQDNTIE